MIKSYSHSQLERLGKIIKVTIYEENCELKCPSNQPNEWCNVSLSLPAYETLSDDKRRREYDQFGHGPSPGEGHGGRGGGGSFNQHFQSFNFNFDDIFKDFDHFGQQQRHHHHFHSHSHSQNQAHQKRHFDSHFRAHQENMNRHKRQFQHGGFGGGLFDDMFEDLEKMFSFNSHSSRTESRFQGSGKQHCRTVTQRRGNMVTTFTDCSWDKQTAVLNRVQLGTLLGFQLWFWNWMLIYHLVE